MNFKTAMVIVLLGCSGGCGDTSTPNNPPAPRQATQHWSSLDWFVTQQLYNQQTSAVCDLLVLAEQKSDDSSGIRFTLRNPGAREWKFEGQLPPWEWCGPSIQLLAVDGSGKVLDTIHPPCSPPNGLSTTIQPGGEVSGDLDLSFVVDDVELALQRGPVAVAWTYRFTGPQNQGCFATGAVALAPETPN